MTTRPCKLDMELQWIWQRLLPDTPFPTCEASNAHSSGGSSVKTGGDEQADCCDEQRYGGGQELAP
jgi:hypothetical protein